MTPANLTDPQAATRIVQHLLDPYLSVTAVAPLHGGMVNRVELWRTSGQPSCVVAKLSANPGDSHIQAEHDSLAWYRHYSRFPVPEPYAVGGNGVYEGTCLLMEYLPGRNLGAAQLSPTGVQQYEQQLADILADLHEHRRDTYGLAAGGTGKQRWLDEFGPVIGRNFEKMAPRFSPSGRETVETLLADLENWLPERHEPTLVHGDIWATNIMIDDRDPDRPRITGFIDTLARFCDVEYELAYLLVFRTAGSEFFRRYGQVHPLRPGYERRFRVYWLNTLMLHVWKFGDDYLPRTEQIAREIADLM